MKVGSLFSGIGGIDLGLECAGMKVIWQVEQNPYCNKVLEKHWPNVKRYGDIKTVDFAGVERPDLICGGFPCQPVSCAGKRQGDKDERWLWPEFYRAICEARPRWVLVENVPGLLSAADGRLFGGILGDLAHGGFDAEWDLLPAAAFGAPHLRFRVLLVAHARSGPGLGRALEPGREAEGGIAPGGDGETLSNPDLKHGDRSGFHSGQISQQQETIVPGGQDVADAGIKGLQEPEQEAIFRKRRGQQGGAVAKCDWWLTEPNVGRVAHGIPSRVDRLKCLGNAVVPQVAEWVGKRIMEAEHDG